MGERTETLLVPYRYGDAGWFDWHPPSPVFLAALWNLSMADEDWQRIEQVRDYAIDKQLVEEKGVTAFLEAKQRGLQMAESSLGQSLDRQSVDAGDAYSTYGISEGVTDLFNSFQSLSASPTSTTERQTALYNAQKLTDKFKSVDRRLDNLRSSLNKEVKADIVNANAKLEQVAYLASSIGNTEQVSGSANEIRDVMQDSLEQLAEFVNLTTSTNDDGKMSVFISGEEFITENVMTDVMKVVTDANGYHSAASSSMTIADIRSARAQDRPLPAGSAVDAAGAPTNVAADVAALLPRGGQIGSLLGLVVELMAGVAAGGRGDPKGRGVFLVAIDPTVAGEETGWQDKLAALRNDWTGAGGHWPRGGGLAPDATLDDDFRDRLDAYLGKMPEKHFTITFEDINYERRLL